MKKRMLALAMALMLAVSCFAAFPASAEGETLTWSITSSDKVAPGGTLDLTVSASANALVEGFLLELSLPTGVSLTVPEGEIIGDTIYLSSLFTTSLTGLAVNEKNGVYSFLYAGFSTNEAETIVYPEDAIDTATDPVLFTFNVTVNKEADPTAFPIATLVKGDAAFNTGSAYALFQRGTDIVTDVTVEEAATELISLNNKYAIDNENFIIRAVRAGTTVADFIDEVPAADGATFTSIVYGELSSDGIIGTGTTITIGENTYYVVVYGDVDGDGVFMGGTDDFYSYMLAENYSDAEYGISLGSLVSGLAGVDEENSSYANYLQVIGEAIDVDLDISYIGGTDDFYIYMLCENASDNEYGISEATLLDGLGILVALGINA